MNAIATVTPKSSAIITAGVIVLPKLAIDGKFTMTTIAADEIKGVQPCTLSYKGKQYKGTKCYTIHGTSFKVFTDPTEFASGWAFARVNATALVAMSGLLPALPGYETSKLPKMLGSGK